MEIEQDTEGKIGFALITLKKGKQTFNLLGNLTEAQTQEATAFAHNITELELCEMHEAIDILRANKKNSDIQH